MAVSRGVGEKRRKWRHETSETLKEFSCEEEKRGREATSKDYEVFANCCFILVERFRHALNAARKESLEQDSLARGGETGMECGLLNKERTLTKLKRLSPGQDRRREFFYCNRGLK